MKLLGYLRSCLPTIALVVAAVALSAFILAVSGAGLAVIVLVSIITCLGLALALAADCASVRSTTTLLRVPTTHSGRSGCPRWSSAPITWRVPSRTMP